MAKIAQVITQATREYNYDAAQSLTRDLDAILEKLNTTYQQDLKDESEAESFFLG